MSDNRNVSESQFGNKAVVIQGDNYAPINASSPGEDSSWLVRISQENPEYHKKRIFESKGPFFPKSFRWILGHEDFNRWRNTDKSGVFWIKGDPGKGKTMLLGGLVDHFKETPGTTNLAYFFCQATDSRINTAAAVIGGLIVSFIKEHDELRSYIHTKYKDDLNKLNGPDNWHMLHDIFEKVTQHSTLPSPVCVVDALDECEQGHGCKQLLRLIIETSCRVKWLISSRNITEIERELQEINFSRRLSLELKGNADYVTKSVDSYIDSSVQSIMALQGDEELKTKTTSTLKSKANGTFLWVALVIEQLRHTKHRNVEDVLDEIPEGLDNLYHLILDRLLKQKDKDAYQILLSTVVAAERPLHLEELLTFISFQWKDYKTTYSLLDIQDLIKDCGSFLSIRDDDKSVNFIHQSVKDYMMGPAVEVIFPSGIEYQNYKMFKTSLSAMSRVLKHNIYGLKDPGSDTYTISPPDPNPLAPLAYCCVFWVEHLFRSCESGASRDKIYLKDGKALHKFLKDKFLCWLEALAFLRFLEPQGIDAMQKLRMLLPGYCRRGTNRSHGEQMANSRRKGEKSRYRFIHRYEGLPFGAYLIKYAYTILDYFDDSSHIRSFIDDAYHFVHHCKDLVRNRPLQLYYSALVFEDTQSAISTSFQQILQTEFKNAPTPIRLPQRRVSLVRNIELQRRDSIIALLYSPDSSFLCSLSSGGIVSLFRTDIYALEWVVELDRNRSLSNSGRHFLAPEGDLNRHFLAFSINSKLLVSISSTGIVQVWAVDCGTQMQKFTLNLSTRLVQYYMLSILQEEVIAISEFGELAASTCRTLLGALISVKVWEMNTGKCSIVIDRSKMSDISFAFFSPNLRMITLIDDKVARVYSVRTGKEIHDITCATHFSIDWIEEGTINAQFSPDSKLLALKCGFNTCLWCTEKWTMVRRIKCRFLTRLFDFFSDAALSVCKGSYEVFLDSMDTGEALFSFTSHVEGRNLIFSPDWTQSSLFASSSDDAIQIWRAFIDTRAKTSDVQNTVEYEARMAISPNSKYVAVWDDGGSIRIWSGESGECIQVLQAEGGGWRSPFFSPDSEHVACVQETKDGIQLWHVRTGKLIHLLKGPGALGNVNTDFSDDSRYIFEGHMTGPVRVWCVESGKCLFEKRFDDLFTGEVAFSPDSRYIATVLCPYTGKLVTTVCTWDWRTGHCISRIQLDRESSFSKIDLAFSLDAKVLVVITNSDFSSLSYGPYGPYTARFYDIASCACLGHINISESNGFPFFDPAKDHIVTDGFIYCKGSSWKDWDTIPQPERFNVTGRYYQETWIRFGQHLVFQIPKHISAITMDRSISISDSLLVFLDTTGEVFFIELPDRDHIEQ